MAYHDRRQIDVAESGSEAREWLKVAVRLTIALFGFVASCHFAANIDVLRSQGCHCLHEEQSFPRNAMSRLFLQPPRRSCKGCQAQHLGVSFLIIESFSKGFQEQSEIVLLTACTHSSDRFFTIPSDFVERFGRSSQRLIKFALNKI